jgi:hypothetical protein
MLVQGNIKSCKDLKGRKIGIQEVGAFNEVMSRAVLASCGLTPKDVDYVNVSTKGRVPGLLSNQIDTAILHVDQALVAKKKKPELNILVNLWEPLPKWLYGLHRRKRDYCQPPTLHRHHDRADQGTVSSTTAKPKPSRSRASTQQDAEVVAQTYDILANAGAWPVNDSLPKDMVEWTINKQVELGSIKAEDKPSYEKLIDLSVVQDRAYQPAGD